MSNGSQPVAPESTIEYIPSQSDRVVVTGSVPNLAPEALFDYWINAVLICRWWPEAASIEPQVGGRYHLAWLSMDRHLRGRYLVIQPGRQLSFTWQWNHDNRPERIVVVDFVREGDGTRFTVTHGTYTPTPEDQAERQSHIDGWLHFLPRLCAVAQ